MSKGRLDIKSILDIPRWEAVQDQLAKTTGTAIITIDYKGTPLTKHSMRTEFCSVIRGNSISRKRCQKCDSLAGLEAVRLNQPFIYLCHCGIVDVAVPITVGDQYLGAVMFGQVRISNGSDAGVERLVNEISSFHTGNAVSALQPDLRELYQRLPEMEYERIRGIADMLNAIVQYIVVRAVDSRAEMMGYEWRLRSLPCESVIADIPVELHALTGAAEQPTAEESEQKSSVIYPAIVYIEKHIHEMLPMREMASLCHLSPSYFSRIFQRDTGENYTDYVNRRKVEQAKELLRNTPDSVSAIASALGFVDVSYFVKLFKRFEGVTPLSYRKLKRSSSTPPRGGKIKQIMKPARNADRHSALVFCRRTPVRAYDTPKLLTQ